MDEGKGDRPVWQGRRSRPRVALLLGKPPERSPVIPDVIDCLRRAGADVRTLVPGDAALPEWLLDADIAALRGLGRLALTAVAGLEEQGLRCCNSARATLALRDRGLVQRTLDNAGVAVPKAAVVVDTDAARRWAAGRPVVVKADEGSAGRSAGVAMWSDPSQVEPPPMSGPYLVQEWIQNDGIDRKVYVLGKHTGGLLKARAAGRRTGEEFDPSEAELSLARAVGEALGLDVYGVDLVAGPTGLVVVDVNAFPSGAGVPGAAAAIADALLSLSRRPPRGTRRSQTGGARTRASWSLSATLVAPMAPDPTEPGPGPSR